VLPDSTLEDLRTRARQAIYGGYEEPSQVVEGLLELVEYDPETEAVVASNRSAAAAEVAAIVRETGAKYLAESAEWPPETDCDRLRSAFHALDSADIAARENVGYDMSDVRYEMEEIVRELVGSGRQIRGWVSFHGQDVERAVDGGGLYLAYAPFDSASDEAWKSVGAEIADSLRQAGLEVTWNGNPDQRIHLAAIRWQNRRSS
jgi:hypothetical protein